MLSVTLLKSHHVVLQILNPPLELKADHESCDAGIVKPIYKPLPARSKVGCCLLSMFLLNYRYCGTRNLILDGVNILYCVPVEFMSKFKSA